MSEAVTPLAASRSIFVSDLHAGLKLPHAKVSADMTSSDRLEDVLDIIEQVRVYAEAEGITRIFILGDLFDQRHPDSPTLIKTARALSRLAGVEPTEIESRRRSTRTVYILPGNHDAHDRAGRVYSIDLFEALRSPGIEIITHGWRLALGGVVFYGMPWLPDRIFAERLAALSVEHPGPRVLLLHQPVNGATEGPYRVKHATDPDVLDEADPAAGSGRRFDLAISGHIHDPQRIRNVQYLGCPLDLRFTDIGPRRGFWVLDESTLTMEMVETKFCPFIRWSFKDGDGLTCDEQAANLLSELYATLISVCDGVGKPAYVEVLIEGPREDADRCRSRVVRVLDADTTRVRSVRYATTYTDSGASDRIRAAATTPGAVASPQELCEAFVRATAPTWPAGVTADELIAFGRMLLP